MSDEAFKELYNDTQEMTSNFGRFSIPLPKYKPSYPFAPRIYNVPWQKS